jgi:hypothetical protein
LKPARGTEPTNPWGLTFLEFSILQAVMEAGDHIAAAKKVGLDRRAVDNAMFRMRAKMGVGNTVHQAEKWFTWKLQQAAGRPRTAWVCLHCSGLGFTVRKAA